MRILIVMDDLARIHPESDTTFVLIEEALRRGHEVEVCTPDTLWIDGGAVFAEGARVRSTARDRLPCVTVDAPAPRAIADCSAVLMRKDPPFDIHYYFATLLLERARGQSLLVNDPRGLRDANEKLYIFNFPTLITRTLVTRSIAQLRRFLDDEGGQMIVKPIDACGGTGVFHVRAEDRNTNVILETCTEFEKKLVMAQHYLAEARNGDKRILLLDGEPIGAVLRVPRADETRGNLHVGGTAVRTELTPREREICAQVGARCKADGLYFVGLDVIGDRLTEVNVTSPTGIQEIDRLEGVSLEARVLDWLEQRTAA